MFVTAALLYCGSGRRKLEQARISNWPVVQNPYMKKALDTNLSLIPVIREVARARARHTAPENKTHTYVRTYVTPSHSANVYWAIEIVHTRPHQPEHMGTHLLYQCTCLFDLASYS